MLQTGARRCSQSGCVVLYAVEVSTGCVFVVANFRNSPAALTVVYDVQEVSLSNWKSRNFALTQNPSSAELSVTPKRSQRVDGVTVRYEENGSQCTSADCVAQVPSSRPLR